MPITPSQADFAWPVDCPVSPASRPTCAFPVPAATISLAMPVPPVSPTAFPVPHPTPVRPA
jgi:hypothetical protein